MKRIGLAGAGAMGEPMGASLMRAGFDLWVSAHKNRDRVDRLLAAGAFEAKNPADLGARCEAVVLSLPDAPQVDEVLFGSGGIASVQAGGDKANGARYVIDMSTISPVATRGFYDKLAQHGIALIDAPVSGGPARAATGELTIMAGGGDDAYAACEPVLRALGTPHHVGATGMGETVKLVNQLMIASIMLANVEGLLFAKKSGADIGAVREILATATASNYLLEKWLPQTWLVGKREGGFAMDLLRKDLRAALDAASRMQLPMPASGLAYQLFTAASGAGHGGEDYSAVSALYEDLAGVRVVD